MNKKRGAGIYWAALGHSPARANGPFAAVGCTAAAASKPFFLFFQKQC
jgi:hypothetical protein